MSDRGVECEEFSLALADRRLIVSLLSPAHGRLARDPALLLTFAAGRESSLFNTPYKHTAEAFLAAGHRALSFDFVGHGERIDRFGSGIDGLRNSLVLGGIDPFAVFAEDARAVIDACVGRGLVRPGRIATSGTSRGGYLALYLLAHEPRVAVAAGFAPVTDWRVLAEFKDDVERPEVVALAMSRCAAQMAGRSVFLTIGRSDLRVGTDTCASLHEILTAAGTEVEFALTDDPGHHMGMAGYERGAAWLLERVSATKG